MENVTIFYDSIRSSLFAGKINQGGVDTINAILSACDKHEVSSPQQIAYVLATARHESYNLNLNPNWLPVREGWGATNQSAINAVTSLFKQGKISSNYALPLANGFSYYGRGFVQITHPGNYTSMGKRLGIDLYNHPDLALDRDVAGEIIVVGMKEGIFTGKTLNTYFNATTTDSLNARRIINGIDQQVRISGYYDKFYAGIIAAG